MEGLSSYLVQCLIHNQIIQEDQEEIYLYGFQLILNSLLTMVWLLFWGCLLGKLGLTIVATICLVHLRQYAGGYHADTYLKCFLISNLSFFMIYQAVIWKVGFRWPTVLVGLSLLSTLYLIKVGTTNHPRNPKTKEELAVRSKKTRINTTLYSVISFIFLGMGSKYVDIATVIICTQVCTALSVRVIKIKKGDGVE